MAPGFLQYCRLTCAESNGLRSVPTSVTYSYSGVIDLAARIEGKWNLVDFKTSMPLEGECIEDFLQREIEAVTVLKFLDIAKSGQSSPKQIRPA